MTSLKKLAGDIYNWEIGLKSTFYNSRKNRYELFFFFWTSLFIVMLFFLETLDNYSRVFKRCSLKFGLNWAYHWPHFFQIDKARQILVSKNDDTYILNSVAK